MGARSINFLKLLGFDCILEAIIYMLVTGGLDRVLVFGLLLV